MKDILDPGALDERLCAVHLGDKLWNTVPPGHRADLESEVERGLREKPDQSRAFDNVGTGNAGRNCERAKELVSTLSPYFDFEKNGAVFACIIIEARISEQMIKLPVFAFKTADSEPTTRIVLDSRTKVYCAWHETLYSEPLRSGTFWTPFDTFTTTLEIAGEDLVGIAGSIIDSGISHLQVPPSRIDSDKHTLTDVLRFMESLLTPDNPMSDFGPAFSMIEEAQGHTLEKYRDGMTPRAREFFDELIGRLRGSDRRHGNAEVIRTLSKINDVPQLFELMVSGHVDNTQVELVPFKKSNLGIQGQLMVHEDLKIHPLALLGIESKQRDQLLEYLEEIAKANEEIEKELAAGEIDQSTAESKREETLERHNQELSTICNQYRLSLEFNHKRDVETLCNIRQVDSIDKVTVGSHTIFKNLSSHGKFRLHQIIQRVLHKDPKLLNIAIEYAKHRGCDNFEKFSAHTEFFGTEYESKRTEQANILRKEKKKGTPYKEEAKLRAFVEIREEKFEDLASKFDDLQKEVSEHNKTSSAGRFKTDALAAYHYAKHKEIKGNLTSAEFFALINRAVERGGGREVLAQDGSCTLVYFEDPTECVRVVKIDTHGEEGWTSGLLSVTAFKPPKADSPPES